MKKLCVIMMVLFVVGQFWFVTKITQASEIDCMQIFDNPDYHWVSSVCMDLALMHTMNGYEPGDVDDLGGWI